MKTEPTAPTSGDDTPEWLLRKYDVAAPRYTSYPSIPFWGDTTAEEVGGWLGEKPPSPDHSLSLYVHVPFCAQRCFYCGCFVIITSKQEQAGLYVDAVRKEMAMVRGQLADAGPVRQFHLGGGTPTFISPEQMTGLVETARSLYPFNASTEMGIEIDPRTVGESYLTLLRELGFNRVSLGVQDFDSRVMESVNRDQPFEMVADVTGTARKLGFQSINFDLIYGLPFQSEASFAQTLERVRELAPDRLAIYNYAHLPRTFPFQRRIRSETLPGPEEKALLIQNARKTLSEWGYVPIGLDHFARPGDDLAVAWKQGSMRRNFMGYTTQAGTDQLAFGISAISEFHRSFWQNEKKLNRYYQRVEEGALPVVRGMYLSDDDLMRKAVISALFCSGRLDYQALGQRFGVDFPASMAAELEAMAPFEEDGLVRAEPGGLTVTTRGRMFLRNLAMVFDPYVRRGGESPAQFSRAL